MKWLLSDFHVHTKMSDGRVPLCDVIDIFGKGGVEVVNIADHLYDTVSDHGKARHQEGKHIKDWDWYSKEIEKAREYARAAYGMVVIRGAEITNYIRGFHIVAVDLKEPVDANLSAEEIIEEIHLQGAIAIVAHPYYLPHAPDRGYVFHVWNRRSFFKDRIDLWEIGNGNTLYTKVEEEGLHYVADSDFHLAEQFFSWKTLVHARKDIASIKKALLLQRVAIIKIHKKPV